MTTEPIPKGAREAALKEEFECSKRARTPDWHKNQPDLKDLGHYVHLYALQFAKEQVEQALRDRDGVIRQCDKDMKLTLKELKEAKEQNGELETLAKLVLQEMEPDTFLHEHAKAALANVKSSELATIAREARRKALMEAADCIKNVYPEPLTYDEERLLDTCKQAILNLMEKE